MNTRSDPKKKSQPGRQRRTAAAKLDKLIEEATEDCYDASEQVAGLYTMLEENLELPFQTEVLGVEVMVERIDLTDAEDLVAICRHGLARQAIHLLDLPLPVPPPQGAEWIEAYRRWARGGRYSDVL